MSKQVVIVVVLALLVGGGYFATRGDMNKNDGIPEVSTDSKKVEPTNTEVTKTDNMEGHDAMMTGAGVVFIEGKIMLEEGKKMTPLTSAYTFDTGIVVSPTGLVTKKDGTTMQLQDGESIWNDGSIMKGDEDMKMDKDMMKDGATMMKKDESMPMKKDASMPMDHDAMKAGSYELYAANKVTMASASHDVVLFFKASWCPSCRAVDADIKANLMKIPSSLTILEVDYDTAADLKKKYGVTYQHTFVQVDAQGNLLKKWSGSPKLADLVAQVQ